MNARARARRSIADFELANHGSLFTLTPLTKAAREWANQHLPEDATTWAGGTVIEPRYVGDIVDGLTGDGLVVR